MIGRGWFGFFSLVMCCSLFHEFYGLYLARGNHHGLSLGQLNVTISDNPRGFLKHEMSGVGAARPFLGPPL